MSSTTAQRRKASTSSKNPESIVLVETGEDAENRPPPLALVATVKRNKCGTGPFDEHWLNVDCCGLFCALFTYGLHAYGCYAVCLILLPPWMSYTGDDGIRSLSIAGQFNRAAFCTIAALAVISHFKAMTTDPGAVPPDAKPVPDPVDEKDNGIDLSTLTGEQNQEALAQSQKIPLTIPPQQMKRLCRRCKAYKPQRAHHCSVCRRCVIKMDHHCPWVNNCVGIGNHKYFLLFVFYTLLSCCYSMVLVITRFSTCMGGNHKRGDHSHQAHAHHVSCLDQPTHLLTMLGLLVEALLFGMFTFCMIFDQMDVITSKVTHIDRLKGSDFASKLAGVTEVFGVGVRGVESRFRADWLSPFAKVCFPPSVHDDVMGFCLPCLRAPPSETELPPRTAARSIEEVV
jgi:hypothetical protein